MHHVKRQAHRFGNDSESSKFNPFARVRTQSTNFLSDEENPRFITTSPTGASEEDKAFNSADGTSTDRSAPNGDVKQRHFWQKKSETEKSEMSRTKSSTSQSGKANYTIWGQLRATVFGSWINVLLLCVPIGIALNYAKVNPLAIFLVNFIAIIPLAGMLSYATEEIAIRVGETMGGLLNASFGNAVEVIVSIIALVKNEIIIVKTSLIGSMLSNLLLVMGMCFFFGGLKRTEQFFNVTVAQTAASLLALAAGSLIIPTAFHQWSNAGRDQNISAAPLSRGTAIILLFVYGAYLFFQLKSHTEMYNEPSKKVEKRPSSHRVKDGAIAHGIANAGIANSLGVAGNEAREPSPAPEDDDDAEVPQLSIIFAVATLCISTAFVGLCAEYMVGSIAEVTKIYHISPEFVGLILIPIVGNAAEHATAVTVAIKDKMDLAIGVAVGSSMQIALFVLPLMVVVGWIVTATKGVQAMTLNFDGFQIAILFVSVLLVNYLIQDGKSHWLEGVMLMSLYIIIAVAAWYYPVSSAVVG